jgi:ribonuclease P protein component
MLVAGQRLRRRREFSAVVRAGRRAARGCVVAHLITQPDPLAKTSPARAGFIIPKTVGNAVTRNKVRRRLRHLLRDRLADLAPGTTVVIRALPAAGSRPYPRLAADLDAAIAAVRTSKARDAR